MVAIELGLVDLIRLTKELAGKSKEQKKLYFDQFIEPIWISFNNIHQDYKKGFKKYSLLSKKLRKKDTSHIRYGTDITDINEELIREIIMDSLYTEDIRIELNSLMKMIPKNQDEKMTTFLHSIRSYFSLNKKLEKNETDPRFQSEETIKANELITNFKLRQVRVQYIPNSCRYLLLAEFQKILNPEIKDSYSIDLSRGYSFDPYANCLEHLQAKYGNVAESYYALRQSFLI